ncbi:MAG: hypothetical protein WCB05_17875 [Candidatus Sulfotelmatobacter sp.]
MASNARIADGNFHSFGGASGSRSAATLASGGRVASNSFNHVGFVGGNAAWRGAGWRAGWGGGWGWGWGGGWGCCGWGLGWGWGWGWGWWNPFWAWPPYWYNPWLYDYSAYIYPNS